MTELEKNAEELAYKWWHSVDKEFVDVIDAYVQGYKNAVDKACAYLLDKFKPSFNDYAEYLVAGFKEFMEEQ